MNYFPEISHLIIVVIVGIVLWKYFPLISKLVNWIVGFTHLSKTKDGFAADHHSGAKPLDMKEKTQKSADKVILQEDEIQNGSGETEKATEKTWLDYYIDNKFDEAIEILDAIYSIFTPIRENR